MSILDREPWVPARKRAKLALEVPRDRPETVTSFPDDLTRIPPENDKFAARTETERDREILGAIASRGLLPIYCARYLSKNAMVVALEKAERRYLEHYRIPQIALERFGLEMLTPIADTFPRSPEAVHETLLAVDAVRVAELYLDKFAPVAEAWFSRHPETAALVLIPAALNGKAKDSARALKAIAALRREGHASEVDKAAHHYGPAAAEELRILLLPPPLPPKPPALPAFLDIPTLPNIPHLERLLQLLALLPLGAARALVEQAREEIAPSARSLLARSLVDRWVTADAPSDEKWVLLAAAVLGDDLVAHQLADNVTTWAEAGKHPRAALGVEALRELGSPVALTRLARLGAKSKHAAVKKRARAALAEYRETHHLSEDELADRLVPSLDLDANGTLTLSYGPRELRAVLDGTLKAALRDGDEPIRMLPKAKPTDDPALVARATAVWNAFKTESKATVEAQVRRLEQAMNRRRRWSREEFGAYFHKHPLMQQIARRLVWGTFDGAALTTTFRIAEDGTFSSADDETTSVDEKAVIGIPHPFAMGAELAARWGNVFGDYEIVQPFTQLAREVRLLTDAEKGARTIDRFSGRRVDGSRFFSLKPRGWSFLDYDLGKAVTGNLFVVLETEPGVEMLETSPPEQMLGVLTLRSAVLDATFALVDPLEMSEVLRDVELLSR